ncbi:MAG: tRNA epoxyqueuosine(34) reductase QueG [Bacteroidia bacterium]
MTPTQAEKHTKLVKQIAKHLGFDYCGISKSGFLEEEAPRLENWLKRNMHGEMHYMENHFDKRLDTTKLVEGSQSVISLLLNYYPEKQLENSQYKISKYAYGEDYHTVIKDKLKEFLHEINEQIGEVHGRAFVDSAPVLDKAWAKKSGLGWMGKHTNLINRTMGSFFFIAELIVDLELEEDKPIKDYCGTCTKCIDACPTDAITEPYVVDGSKCISYFTIELKGNLPDDYKGKFENWAFGCDICQDVCPWNKFSKPSKEQRFEPSQEILNLKNSDWEEITEEVFSQLFKKSAVKRTKFEGLKRNINFLR